MVKTLATIYYVAGLPFSSELYHHGIIGQKWGVRRYQNSDGSLTEEGKVRYSRKSQSGARYSNYLDNIPSKRYYSSNDLEIEAYRCSKDRKIKSEVNKRTPDDVRQSIARYEEASSKLNAKFLEYSEKLKQDRGKEWDGDGSEEHSEMEKRYPEYRKISESYDIKKRNALRKVSKAVESGIYDEVFKNKDLIIRSDMPENGTTMIYDGRKSVVATIIANNYGDHDYVFIPQLFEEWRDLKKGKVTNTVATRYY